MYQKSSYNRVKTPTILQMEAVECGAASLAIILAYFGKYIPLEELRIGCDVSRDGSKASNVIKAAAQYNLTAKGFKLELEELFDLPPPFIVFWNFNHFLVVEGFGKKSVYLNDPAGGPRQVSYNEFDENFTGVVLTFSPDENFQKSGTPQSMWKALTKRLQGSTQSLIYISLASLGLTIPGLLVPILTKMYIDNYLIQGLKNWVFVIITGLAFTALFRGLFTLLRQRVLLQLQTKLTILHSNRFFWHILRLPIVFYAQRFAGDLAQRVDSNTLIAQLIVSDLAINAANIISMFFFAIMMFHYDIPLTLIGIFFALLNIAVLRYVARTRIDQNYRLLQERGKLMATTINGLRIIETIKATGGEGDNFLRWSGYQAKVTNTTQVLELYTRILTVMPFVLSGLMNACILGVGGLRVIHGELTIGTLIAFQTLMQSFSQPINNLVGLASKLQDLQGTLNRLDDVLKAEIDPLLIETIDQSTHVAKLAGYLELRNISFGYNKLSPPLIENFNLSIQPGMRVALVGATGSGKSTVIKLITGINQPWSGQILFDGKERNNIPRSLFTYSFASVDQDIHLFEGTVWENLTLWDKTRAEEDVLTAAKDAAIHDIIMKRSLGYDFPVGENGLNFSGGERQRIEIARALVGNPSILILDEATAALDPITEKYIDNNLRRRGCTCLIVAHRLSTIRDCDHIIVMDKGKVLEQGTHADLCALKGRYAELIQMEKLA